MYDLSGAAFEGGKFKLGLRVCNVTFFFLLCLPYILKMSSDFDCHLIAQ